jgi:hypothetical protein
MCRSIAVVVMLCACGDTTPQYYYLDAPAPDGVFNGDGAVPPDGPSATAACATIALDRCTKVMTCSPPDLQKQFGTEQVCLTREQLACGDNVNAVDTGATPEGILACAAALTAESCAVFLSPGAPSACIFTGPNSGTCSFESQCGTQFCAVGAHAQCGLSEAYPVVGTSCVDSECGEKGLVCDKNTSKCAQPALQNQTCNPTIPCAHALACVGSINGSNGRCELEVTTLGGSCDFTRRNLPSCNIDVGLTCSHATNKCVMQPIVAAGKTCGQVNSIDTACIGGTHCFIPRNQTSGKCVADAPEGMACNTSAGPDCFFPARCMWSTATGPTGTCQLPGTTSC